MEDILKILNAGLKAVDGERAVLDNVKVVEDILYIYSKKFDLAKFKNVYIIGIGKVSGIMALGLERILKNKITEGLVIVKNRAGELRKIKQVLGNHPVPDEKSLRAGEKILKLAQKAQKDDLVIVLLSGGASALAVSPKGVSLKDKQKIAKVLLENDVPIEEINTIRKHLSNIKGGGLAKESYPAACITLIISDVLNNDLSVIGSGPTVLDKSTFKDCLKILEKHKLKDKLSKVYRHFLKESKKDKKEVTISKNIFNFIIADLEKALNENAEAAKKLEYKTKILLKRITGIASKQGEKLARATQKLKPKSCQISGGETTAIITGKGRGGRNLELALGFLKSLAKGDTLGKDVRGISFVSVGTDGDDGVSGVAGALVGEKELEKAQNLKLDFDKYLSNNNSLELFKKTGGILKFSQRTNVGDIQILLKK